MMPSPNPTHGLSDDPGDEVQRRFRYQSGCAAIAALATISESGGVKAIYCEQYEDVLHELSNGLFIGSQVKTREEGLGPLSATDEAIVGAVRRFVALDRKFPGKFQEFSIITNGAFSQRRQDHRNLPLVCEHATEIQRGLRSTASPLLLEYLRKARDGRSCTNQDLIRVLCRIKCVAFSKLDDLRRRIYFEIQSLDGWGDARLPEVLKATDGMIELASKAAARAREGPQDDIGAILGSTQDEIVRLRIAGKRISKEDVEAVLSEARTPDGLLVSADGATIARIPRGVARLEKKLAAGGLTVQNVQVMKDAKASAEKFLIETLYKLRRREAEATYQHLWSLVKSECQELYDEHAGDEPFGLELLKAIRRRLREIHDKDASVRPSRYQHLVGVASMLGEDCQLWWSKPFDVGD